MDLLSNRGDLGLEQLFVRSSQQREDTFQREQEQSRGRFTISTYLEHQALKLVRRFDANTYITLTRAMSLFDLGRNRDGIEAALQQMKAPLTVVGMDTDRHFPIYLQQQIA